MSDTSNMILRTVYLPPKIDNLLNRRTFHANISKNELIRQYLSVGIQADHAAVAREAREAELAAHGLAQQARAAATRASANRRGTPKNAAKKQPPSEQPRGSRRARTR